MKNEYLRVARITKPVGIHGEIKVFSTTTFKDIRYKKGNKLFLKVNDEYRPLTVKSYRQKDAKFDILSFQEITTPEEWTNYQNFDLFTLKDEKILDENEFFYSDLVGCKVLNNETKEILGTVASVEEFPSQLTLKVKRDEKHEFYVPFISQFVTDIDINKKEIFIKIIEGLL